MEKILYIIGAKASGKSNFAKALVNRFKKLSLIDTYTDRPKRRRDEKGHVFLSPEEFTKSIEEGIIDAYGKPIYREYRIGISQRSLDEKLESNKVPVVVTGTPDIVDYLRKGDGKDRDVLGILVDVDPLTAQDRALSRGSYNSSPLLELYLPKKEIKALSLIKYDLKVVGDRLTSDPIIGLFDRPTEDMCNYINPMIEDFISE